MSSASYFISSVPTVNNYEGEDWASDLLNNCAYISFDLQNRF